ncbi:MAG: peptidylprolyl isomerase [Paracoccaceae bacterium]
MFKHTIKMVAVVAGFTFAAPALAQDVSADTVVATVNGTDLTIGHMIVLRDSLPAQYDNLGDDALFQGILEQLIQQLVLSQTVDEPSLAVQIRLENESRALLAGAAMGIAVGEAVTDASLQAAYDEQYANASEKVELNASHILVETREEAEALIVELEGGADFGDLAKEKSTGPSGPGGGELGWFGLGAMVPEFEDAVLFLAVGEISQPVQTQFGWHVIRLNDTRLLAAPTLDDVRDTLTQQIEQQAVGDILDRLTEAADIERPDISAIEPSVLNNTALVEN